MTLKNKVVIVTGASQGIGEEMVKAFSQLKAKVVLVARNEEKLNEIAQTLHGDCLVLPTDLMDEGSVINMIANVMEKYKRIDVLINNAGYVEPAGLLEMTLKQWNDMIAVNLTGTFLCTREATKFMKKDGGKIINIASTAGISARPGWSGYAAAKAGVINFSLSMAEELRNYNIKVFCICPGRTATNLRKRLAPNEDPTTIMQPQSVVDMVKFCLSQEADVLEGQPILVRERK